MLGQQQPFDQNGNPVVGQFQAPTQATQPSGTPTPAPQPVPTPLDANVQAVITQNQQLMQQLQQNQQPAVPAPVAPPRPQNFNPHEIYDVETETGRWHIAQQEYERNSLLGNVGTIIKEELGQVRQEQQFDNSLTTFANQTGMSPQQAGEFKTFLDNPQADMNTLYEVFKTKQQITAPPPAPGQTPMQPQNIPTPQNLMRNQPPPIQETGNNQLVQTPEALAVQQFEQAPPPPITSVGSPSGGTPPAPTFAEMAKAQGFAR